MIVAGSVGGPYPVLANVARCSRCRGLHRGLLFTPLRIPTATGFTHWASCPTTGEPILTFPTAPLETSTPRRRTFFEEVVVERERQGAKWGLGTPGIWTLFVVLGEEVGEVARAILKGDAPNLCDELIQVGAVVCRMFEHHAGGEGVIDAESMALVKPPHPDVGKCQDPSCDACHGLEPIR